MKPRHNAEQSTVRVNKAEAMGRRGFAAIGDLEKSKSFKTLEASPIESGEAITVTMPVLEAISVIEEVPEIAQPILEDVPSVPVKTEPFKWEIKKSIAAEAPQELEVAKAEAPRKRELNIHVSDPGDEMVCDSCQ